MKKTNDGLLAHVDAMQDDLDELQMVRWCVRQVLPDAFPEPKKTEPEKNPQEWANRTIAEARAEQTRKTPDDSRNDRKNRIWNFDRAPDFEISIRCLFSFPGKDVTSSDALLHTEKEVNTGMNLFEAVKEAVPTRIATEHYGIKVRRNGMACCCPFHSDRTPSMKLDKRFHCFGCQADGDVIDFTAKLFGIPLWESAQKLAQDFGVSCNDRHYYGRSNARASPVLPQLAAAQEYQQAERRVYRVYCDYFHLLRQWKENYAPQSPDEEWDDRFVEACQKLSYVEYLFDTLITGSIEDRAAIVKEHGKDVSQLEKRISELITAGTGSRTPGGTGIEPPAPASYRKAKSAHGLHDRTL